MADPSTSAVPKRLVEARLPLSTQPSKETRYYVSDPHLRFWLSFIGPSMPAIERGRGDQVLAAIKERWSSWRGRGRIDQMAGE